MSQPLLIDRDQELEELRALRNERRPRMGLLFGRRRVGKTYLLQHAFQNLEAFYFLAADTTPELNRQDLIRKAAGFFETDLQAEDYPTWRTVFQMLLDQQRADDPLTIVLDEFQYLMGDEDDAASQLAAVWDGLSPDRPILLILCGSAVRILEHLDSGGLPLFGRFNWKRHLKPFDYFDASLMVPYPNLRSRAELYGAFGGTPYYLASVDPSRTIAENITSRLLDPHGEVRIQLETSIDQEGWVRKTAEYRSILAAVGTGRTEVNEIAQRAGLKNDRALRRMLGNLVEMGYLVQRRNFRAPSNQPHRYYLADPALRFYYQHVLRFRNELVQYDPDWVWRELVQPVFAGYMGLVFEEIVRQAFFRWHSERDLPLISEWSRWEGLDRNREPVEIDVVAEASDGTMITGSVKWSQNPIGAGLHAHHFASLQRLAVSGQEWAHRALEENAPFFYVSAGGFTDGLLKAVEEENRRIILWALPDIYPYTPEILRLP